MLPALDSLETLDAPASDIGSAELRIGDLVGGRYRLLERLGNGAAAVVHLAYDERLGREVAIKIIEREDADHRTLERLAREAHDVARIHHANVVRVHAFGRHGGAPFLCMERVKGRDLEAILRAHAAARSVMPFGEALEIVEQLARGLSAIHAEGLLHLDVKPSNVVVEDETGRAVLVDFGVARMPSRPVSDGSFVGGTPSYMAPEQIGCFSPETLTPRTDLYALAGSAFEMFTGRRIAALRNAYELVLSRKETPPPRVSDFRPELAPLDDVIARALAKDPARRPADCAAFVAELEVAADEIYQATFPISQQRPISPALSPRPDSAPAGASAALRR